MLVLFSEGVFPDDGIYPAQPEMSIGGQESEVCSKCKLPRPVSGWPRDPSLGRLVQQKYRLEERLGSGGFAVVYRATQLQGDLDLGQVALKFLRPHMAENESVRRRFINEARAAHKVGSPHAVKVFDLGFDEDGVPFMAMEYLRGSSLDTEVAARGGLPAKRVVDIGLQVAGALAECHSLGIIHRDLKPDNLILLDGEDGDFVKVLDFGISRVPDPDGATTHTVMGTPRYMPPEQILQKKIDGGVDIFALGVILYECLAGRAPIPAETPMEYLQLNIHSAPVPLRLVRPDLSEDLESLLGKMMAKERDQRPASMGDVAMRLKAIRRNLVGQEPSAGEGTLPDLASGQDKARARIKSEAALAETVTLEEGGEHHDPSTRTMERSLSAGGRWRKYGLAALSLFALIGITLRIVGPGRTGGSVQTATSGAVASPGAPASSPAAPAHTERPAARRVAPPDAATPGVKRSPDAGQPAANGKPSAAAKAPPAKGEQSRGTDRVSRGGAPRSRPNACSRRG